ncbi:MAG: hypothetical protein R3F11_23915 [Verrucomicrobiales bacterium]
MERYKKNKSCQIGADALTVSETSTGMDREKTSNPERSRSPLGRRLKARFLVILFSGGNKAAQCNAAKAAAEKTIQKEMKTFFLTLLLTFGFTFGSLSADEKIRSAGDLRDIRSVGEVSVALTRTEVLVLHLYFDAESGDCFFSNSQVQSQPPSTTLRKVVIIGLDPKTEKVNSIRGKRRNIAERKVERFKVSVSLDIYSFREGGDGRLYLDGDSIKKGIQFEGVFRAKNKPSFNVRRSSKECEEPKIFVVNPS